MDLKYCDNCGTTVNEIAANISATGTILCSACQGKGTNASSNSPLSFMGGEAASDDGTQGSGATDHDSDFALDESLDLFSTERPKSASGSASARRRPKRRKTKKTAEPNLNEGMTLFSSKTIVGKQAEFSKRARRPSPDPSSGSASTKSPSTRSPSTESPSANKSDVETPWRNSLKDSLTLYSEQSVVAKKSKYFGDDPAIRGVVEGSLQESADSNLTLEPNPTGSNAPAPTAKRLQFHCMSCHSRLVVRPVKKTSKMDCPRCSTRMFVEPSGQVSGKRPPKGVEVPSDGSGTIVPNLDRRRKQREIGAGALPKKTGTGSEESSPAVEPPEGSSDGASEGSTLDALPAAAPRSPEPLFSGTESLESALDAGALSGNLDQSTQADRPPPPPPRSPEESDFDPDTLHSLLMSQVRQDHEEEPEADSATQDDVEFESETPLELPAAPRQSSRAGNAPEIQRLPPSGNEWRMALTAIALSLILALPVAVLGYLVQPPTAASSATEAADRGASEAAEKAGTVLERGLGHIVDALGHLFSSNARPPGRRLDSADGEC